MSHRITRVTARRVSLQSCCSYFCPFWPARHQLPNPVRPRLSSPQCERDMKIKARQLCYSVGLNGPVDDAEVEAEEADCLPNAESRCSQTTERQLCWHSTSRNGTWTNSKGPKPTDLIFSIANVLIVEAARLGSSRLVLLRLLRLLQCLALVAALHR